MNLINNITQIAKKVLLSEAEAIARLADFIDEDFQNCVEAILNIKGRVVVTGIGKSANIAQKIVATLNSTGTPALFMHAADAIHGDLGMIQPEDFVICISKSGNTPEIKVLVPLLKRKGSKLVALVSSIDSYLAESADFVLNANVEREACPNNLAPTTSTTAALALGDALAVCLLEARGFSSSDFARLHPGGSLGKRLYLKVEDIYRQNQAPKVTENASLRQVIIEISSKRLGATAVVKENSDELVGIITDGDLRRMLDKYESTEGIIATDIMTASPLTIEPDHYAAEAMAIMQEKNITQLIVTDSGKFEGFVHLHDLLKEGLV
ncbi:KpsF/GutQ family sugar-phosphate isomerase [Pontibacter sp. BT310]|uniref:KpsF/GutQ family sugar-phosphate isomerase n=1 Tax=Pontibacter populi TaxID=890055 RepID=A0ABS6X7F3_9BACT|nr:MULTISPECIES: KpsF/GutQ family sugar-phosphate isomerase [Pontibacter]MBJ6117077.1 KpsF/GutQ family sugar-phosphate isomerase [Pontibacter sp. BT310]MBR0569501.1 KpsF/GutQ family sugar-phosphate isomerase [Microvirga sp. STS03]MBW3363930.1 KpsF/GutQ family sugar-phosphate isomerase [Pontibacter populi]